MKSAFLLRAFCTFSALAISIAGYSTPTSLRDSIEVVFKDTMHVRGKVVDEKGMPLKAIGVSTRGYFASLVWATTDAQGYYLLKNVQPNDTIFFRRANRMTKIYPEGSRILNVVLPEDIRDGWVRSTVMATRSRPKEIKNSTLKYDNSGVFPTHDIWPDIKGGLVKLEKDLSTKVIYPDKARTANIEGMVKIQFLINTEGTPTEFKTVQGLGYGCEEAVIEVLKATKWKYGVSNGYPYFPTMSVKVVFKLEDR